MFTYIGIKNIYILIIKDRIDSDQIHRDNKSSISSSSTQNEHGTFLLNHFSGRFTCTHHSKHPDIKTCFFCAITKLSL